MKKLLCIVGIIFFTITTQAQENQLLSKKGIPILPEAGDWAIGVDAVPFLNLLNNSSTTSFSALRPGQFFGKYYVNENTAYRLGLIIGFTSETEKDGNPFDPDLTDKYKQTSLNIGASFGLEKNKSIRGRLRGFYGLEGTVQKIPYYGWDYNTNDIITGKYNFEDDNDDTNNFVEEGGNTLAVSVNGFVGVEYFFAPKMSLSGEFGIGAGYYYTFERSYKLDNDPEIIFDSGGSEFSIKNTANGSIGLFIYF